MPNAIYSDAEFMALVAGMTGKQVLALLDSDPSFATRLSEVQDADAVAAWWQSLAPPVGENEKPIASDIQQQLLEAHPTVFGNLGGIWYTHRDIANQIAFNAQWEPIEALAAEYFDLIHTFSNSTEYDTEAADFLAQHGYTVSEFMDVYLELRQIDLTLEGAPPGGTPPYQLVQFQPGDPMLAAVSVGNMDTATQITTDVPGMGSEVTRSLREWTMTAENVWLEQTAANHLYGLGEDGLAVVAWIGYDSPAMPPSVEVWGSDHAQAGGDELVGFLTDITATRDWDPGQNLSVIGHSYGTTTAAFALAETPVENFIMLGSAGIDASIPTVDSLMVDPDNVWASEAMGDSIADLGRGDIELWGFFDIPIINDAISGGVHEHQIDPTSDAYGANVFSSETGMGVNADGQPVLLEGSTGHPSTPQLEALLTGDPTDDYGYLDNGTHPLQNAAMLSLGLSGPVVSDDAPSSGGGGV